MERFITITCNNYEAARKESSTEGLGYKIKIETCRMCSVLFRTEDYELKHILLNVPIKKKLLNKSEISTQNYPTKEATSELRLNKKKKKQELVSSIKMLLNSRSLTEKSSENGDEILKEIISNQDSPIEDIFKNINIEWHQWCRLCAKVSKNEGNIFDKGEDSSSISDKIQQIFSIKIHELEGCPKTICSVCSQFLSTVQAFCERVKLVEKVMLELNMISKAGEIIDVNLLKKKYNLENIENYEKLMNDNKSGIICTNIDEGSKTNSNPIKSCPPSDICTEVMELDDCEKINKLQINKITKLSLVVVEESNDSIKINDRLHNSESDKFQRSENLRQKRKNNLKKIITCDRKYKSKEKKKYECEECQVKFIRESNYVHHLKKFHNIVKPILPCKICGKICKTKQKLKFHLELHLPPEEREKLLFKCPECSQKFTQKGAMQSHIRAQHSFEKPYICEHCGKKFASQTNLWSHRRSHDDKNHLACPKCPKIFKNQFRLTVHMRGHNDSCHPCSICGLVLKTMITLKNHMLVHSDAKPFKCKICSKEFKRDKNLQNHLITHSGLRPFCCRFCSQTYANRSNCKKHEKHAHSEDYEAAASVTVLEPQRKVIKKLPNIQQLEAMLDQINPVMKMIN